MDHEPPLATGTGGAGVKAPHPLVYFGLYLPFGLSSGFIGALGYILAKHGLGVDAVGAILALYVAVSLPLSLTSPVVDLTGSYRGWFVFGATLTGIAIAVFGLVPADKGHMPLLIGLVLALALASRLSHQAGDGLIARVCPQDRKGVAGAWTQTANVGGAAISGGLGIYLADHAPYAWISPVTIGLITALGLPAILFVGEPPRPASSGRIVDQVRQSLVRLARDLWSLTRSRNGALALLLSLLPLSTGAASNLFPAVGGQWHASGDLVALVNGAGGGLFAIIGCVGVGYLCDRLDRKSVYVGVGLLLAALSVVMAIFPKTPQTYVVSVLVYTVLTGGAYAAFYAFAQEVSGHDTAASRLALIVGISNLPISTMTYVDGVANARGGPDTMLLTETVIGLLAAGLFLAVRMITKPKPLAAAPAAGEAG